MLRHSDAVVIHVIYRLIVSIPVIFGVLVLGFVLMNMVPTDPAIIVAGDAVTDKVLEAIRKELGLDRTIAERFLFYIGKFLQGDLGRSLINKARVIDELRRTIGPSAELMVASVLWSSFAGVALGTLAAVKRRSLIDRAIMAISVTGVCMPSFMIGLLLIYYVGFVLQVLPFQGRGGPLWTLVGLEHLLLPSLSLGSLLLGPVARMTRTSLLDVLGQDFIRTARAKGLKESSVVLHHGLRNAMIPTVTVIGLQAGYLLGGAVITETIFAWPGVGRLAVGAISAGDYPVAQGTILVLALSFILFNLVVDISYVYLDPAISKS